MSISDRIEKSSVNPATGWIRYKNKMTLFIECDLRSSMDRYTLYSLTGLEIFKLVIPKISVEQCPLYRDWRKNH